jgi:NIMA (never in mitosis gene a)-related kinase
VKLGNLTDKEKQNALNEVRILASVNHKNIIGYKEAFIDEVSNCLLYT